jgi:hypothetical protein
LLLDPAGFTSGTVPQIGIPFPVILSGDFLMLVWVST